MSRKKYTLNRRQSLKLLSVSSISALAANPLETLFSGIANGLISKAMAQENITTPRNYIHINLTGSPPRWLFDLPLINSEADRSKFIGTHGFASQFKHTPEGHDTEYNANPYTYNGSTIYLPKMWDSFIPRPPGKSAVQLKNLSHNMLSIRGINMKQDGHFNNMNQLLRPLSEGESIGGIIANHSNKSLSAITLPRSPLVFNSKQGKIPTVINQYLAEQNTIKKIFSPFDQSQDLNSVPYQNILNERGSIEASIRNIHDKIKTYSGNQHPGLTALKSSSLAAESLIEAELNQFAEEFDSLKAKYESLISKAFTFSEFSIPGINDRALGPYIGSNQENYANSFNHFDAKVTNNADRRDIVTSETSFNGLSSHFAVIEFLIKRGFSSHISCGFPLSDQNDPVLLNLNNSGEGFVGRFDAHETGVPHTLLIFGPAFLAISACLYELIDVLKSSQSNITGKSLFDETVIHLACEFTRSPNIHGRGSDHGWRGGMGTLFSGAIKRPMVVGNIKRQDTDEEGHLREERYPGTWGVSGKTKLFNIERELNVGNFTSTVCHLLRIPPIMTNDESLVTESGDDVSANVEDAKIVDE